MPFGEAISAMMAKSREVKKSNDAGLGDGISLIATRFSYVLWGKRRRQDEMLNSVEGATIH